MVLLPVDVAALGSDGPRVRAALVTALRSTLKDDLRVFENPLPQDATTRCAARPVCLGEELAEDVDEVLAVRADRQGASSEVWGSLHLQVHQVPSGRVLLFSSPIAVASADRDVRALVVRAFEPARYLGLLDVVGVGVGGLLLVDGLPTSGHALRLRPGRHDVTVIHPDHTTTTATAWVLFEGNVRASVERAAPSPTPVTATPPPPATTQSTPGAPHFFPASLTLVASAAATAASAVALGVVVAQATGPTETLPRDVWWVCGISLAVGSWAAATSTAIEAIRLVQQRETRATTTVAHDSPVDGAEQ